MKADFITVHVDGDERIINLAWVEEIYPGNNCLGSTIHFAFQAKDAIEPDYIYADESYNKLKAKIMERRSK